MLLLLIWSMSLVCATAPNAIYYKHSCLDDFAYRFAAASNRAEACATMLVHGLPCVDTAPEKIWFVETFENGTCAFLRHLIPTQKPTKTKRGVLDWLDSIPHEQGTLPETMHKIWSYHAEKLKGSKYRHEAEGAKTMSRYYARKVGSLDKSSTAATRKWSAFAFLMLLVTYVYVI